MLLELSIKPFERPIGENGNYCINDVISTLAGWVDSDYELMYIDSWNFHYEEQKKNDETIGQRLNLGFDNCCTHLDNIHGIKLNIKNLMNPVNTCDTIKFELSQNRPVILKVDSFWVPWDNGFGNSHNTHYILCVGYDEQENNYICLDCFLAKYNVALTLEQLENGVLGYITYSITQVNNINPFDWVDIISSNAKSKLLSKQFHSMQKLSEDIFNGLDMDKEMHGYNEIWECPIFKAFDDFARSRMEYSIALKYIGKKSHELKDIFNQFSASFESASMKWNNVKSLLCKIYYRGDKESKNPYICEKIQSIMNFEKDLATELSRLDIHSLVINNSHRVLNNTPYSNNYYEAVHLDIANLYNNKAFGKFTAEENTADFDGSGFFFIDEKLQHNDIWHVENMNFYFPYSQCTSFDNISCLGQKINVKEDFYRCIMFLGTCDWGTYFEDLDIIYADGTIKKLNIGFPDWVYKPTFGEKVAWKGEVAFRKGKEVRVADRKNHIFAKSYSIGSEMNISAIRLPECANIHIFAITMGK